MSIQINREDVMDRRSRVMASYRHLLDLHQERERNGGRHWQAYVIPGEPHATIRSPVAPVYSLTGSPAFSCACN